MKTLTAQQAATLLHLHPATVLEKARAGEIPAAKPGKRWVFLEDDLAAYLRSLYARKRRALKGDPGKELECHSFDAKTRRIGGSSLPMAEDAYSKALGLPTAAGRRSTTTS
jgi:excisionase family DNA binding protein